jgi:hypothetical protein
MGELRDIAARLSAGAKGRTEADIQSDLRTLLLLAGSLGLVEEDLEVFLEAPAGGGRRIDIEAGATVIEVKKSIRPGRAVDAAIAQLPPMSGTVPKSCLIAMSAFLLTARLGSSTTCNQQVTLPR